MNGTIVVDSSADANPVAQFFLSTYGVNIEREEASRVLDALGLGSDVQGVKRALAGDIQAVRSYLKVSHSAASRGRDDWLLQIAQKSPIFPLLEDPLIQRTFQEMNLNPLRSIHLYSGFLGQAEFEWARRLADIDMEASNRVLLGAERHLAFALDSAYWEDLARASRYQNGMLGVINFILASTETAGPQRDRRLLSAIHHLERSEASGDRSPEHFRYLGASYLDLADETRQTRYLEAAYLALSNASAALPTDSEALSLLGQSAYKLAVSIIQAGGDSGEADRLLAEAIHAYERTLEAPPSGYPEKSLNGRLGAALYYTWWTRGDAALVAEAVKHLRIACEGSITWTHQLAQALLLHVNQHGDSDDGLSEALRAASTAVDLNGSDESLKLRARIYIAMAYELGSGHYAGEALADLLSITEPTDRDLPRLTGHAYGLRGLYTDDIDDLRRGEELLRDNEASSEDRPGLYPRLCRRFAELIVQSDAAKALSLVSSAIGRLEPLVDGRQDPRHITMLGGAYLQRYYITGSVEDLERAREAYELAVGFEDVTSIDWYLAGVSTLRSAKLREDEWEQEELLRSAIAYFDRAEPHGEAKHALASRRGESRYRLARITREPHLLNEALRLLQQSRDEGNSSAENDGMIGDVYYYLSRHADQVVNLKRALAFKEEARAKAPPTREHLSLVANVEARLYRATNDEQHLQRSIEFLVRAIAEDPTWPWPICQIAELAGTHGRPRELLLAHAIPHLPMPWLVEHLMAGNDKGIWLRAATMTLDYPETRSRVIGGKSRVWVERDPLGLLESAFVFKPSVMRDRLSGLRALHSEAGQLAAVSTLLERGGYSFVELPQVLGVEEISGKPILIMRRSLGRPLSRVLMYGNENQAAEALENATRFLAFYHASVEAVSADTNAVRFRNHMRGLSKNVIGDPAKLSKAIDDCVNLTPALPVVPKRDAHTGNWLVLPEARLLALDIEWPAPRYLMEELPQLIDDVPFLGLDRIGINQRLHYIRLYLDEFYSHRQGIKVLADEEALALYGVFALCHCLQGLRIAHAATLSAISSSGVQEWGVRTAWYLDLMKFLGSSGMLLAAASDIRAMTVKLENELRGDAQHL